MSLNINICKVWFQIEPMQVVFTDFEFVSCGRETQIREGEKLNYITKRFNPFKPEFTIVILIHYKPRIAIAILVL